MAAVAFPTIAPSSRNYSPGKYSYSEFKALNGATTRMIYGNRRSDAELSLGFKHISDTQAASILAHYETITPTSDWASFTTSDVAAGASTAMANYLREVGGSGLRWRYAEPPTVESITPGISSVDVKLVGQLDP